MILPNGTLVFQTSLEGADGIRRSARWAANGNNLASAQSRIEKMAMIRSLETSATPSDSLSPLSENDTARVAGSFGFLMMADSGQTLA